ncbi:hypothetical protein KQH42_28260 [Streptomyces sp. CHA1]|uniref:hypothetical protein n=1 Tax=Streptomyces TaxID=1883 RepID=UPI001BFC466E|nr:MULTISPECIES: hypothetical protein [unclassified Streptomyces]MBT3160132.1 hypothetical protein [Streptomyces sp. G11C]MCO6704316.1 hypothetical protein [Streptomyces sp. CHB9.2]MCO6710586.1 hypothetical protein [Streptomyces sp. CHA3]MCO6716386.1 hypothetical protein [Streptomyces sp. CHB19.2]MCO6722517.1 hypothetical protein [Streptomyces sp. Vc714c-19]
MSPGNTFVTFDQAGTRVRAWVSTSSFPPSAFKQDHRHAALAAPLRQRGLECTVEYGLSDYIVHAELPDGSTLIISPPQEPASEHPDGPESWIATRQRSAGLKEFEVIYDSGPDGPHARHGGDISYLLAAIDDRLDDLGVAPMSFQERTPAERAAGAVLYRAGFIHDLDAMGGGHFYRSPAAMSDPGVQRQLVTRAVNSLRSEGFHPIGDPTLLDPDPSPAQQVTTGKALGNLTQSVRAATDTGEAVAPLSELTAPGDGLLHYVIEVLDATADWWEGISEPDDLRYVDNLRLIAHDLGQYAIALEAIRDDLADRDCHVTPSDNAQAQARLSSASPRVAAALASSPSAGQSSTAPGAPPPASPARSAPPTARPSSGPRR